jgi:hypothetical protein
LHRIHRFLGCFVKDAHIQEFRVSRTTKHILENTPPILFMMIFSKATARDQSYGLYRSALIRQ